MLKRRIIPVMLLKNNMLVKTKNFNRILEVGDPIKSAKTYSDSDADELIILNIDRKNRNYKKLLEIIPKIREQCFLPISYGGGISNIDEVEKLISNGADKVIVNTHIFKDYNFIKKIQNNFGSQSIIISIDVKKEGESFSIYSNCGQIKEEISLKDHINKCLNCGAGEIFINSIDKDGLMKGCDLELIRYLSEKKINIIYCGGVGNFKDLQILFNFDNIKAAGCSSLFNFGDNNPIRAKQYLMNYFNDFKIIDNL